jgi:sialate O-acetylesterase
VTDGSGETPLELHDVLVGEVWLCSGQSNMDFTVAKTAKYNFAGVMNEAEEVAAANYPRIRMFTGEWTKSYEPQHTVEGIWKICSPENVREFCAVGYFFARRLQREIDVPVGIVTLTYGASTAQAWIRREAIAADPRLKPSLAKFDEEVVAFRANHEVSAQFAQKQAEWDVATEEARAKGQPLPRRPRNPDPVQDQHNPTVMFNGMISPVVPFAIRGVLWYQGESITAPRELFPLWNETLIKDWRKLWGARAAFLFLPTRCAGREEQQPRGA